VIKIHKTCVIGYTHWVHLNTLVTLLLFHLGCSRTTSLEFQKLSEVRRYWIFKWSTWTSPKTGYDWRHWYLV